MNPEKPRSAAQPKQRNWVAKNAPRFNKARVFADRTAYQRKPKHKQRPESWPVASLMGLPARALVRFTRRGSAQLRAECFSAESTSRTHGS